MRQVSILDTFFSRTGRLKGRKEFDLLKLEVSEVMSTFGRTKNVALRINLSIFVVGFLKLPVSLNSGLKASNQRRKGYQKLLRSDTHRKKSGDPLTLNNEFSELDREIVACLF